MKRIRIIPCLLLKNRALVKSIKFKNPTYVGDPINTVRIFNEMEVDELIFLDITATREKKPPQFELIHEIASECFMPFTYGGGISSIEDMKRIFSIGAEKISINTFAHKNPYFISKAADLFGSQSIIVSMDVKKNLLEKYSVYTEDGGKNTGIDPVEFSVSMEKSGAGEILLTSMDRDGTFAGYDLGLIKMVSSEVEIPVIACGGAGCIADFRQVESQGGASAAAVGSLVLFQNKNRSVLINFPSPQELKTAFEAKY